MIAKEPKIQELDREHIRATSNEQLAVTLDFRYDISSITFTLYYKEHMYPYMASGYKKLDAGTISTGFVVSNSADVNNSVLTLTIPLEKVAEWENRNLDVQLVANDGTNTWVAYDGTFTIAQGN